MCCVYIYVHTPLNIQLPWLLLPSDDSTDTPGLSAEGITGRVFLILTEVISLFVWAIAVFAATVYTLLG